PGLAGVPGEEPHRVDVGAVEDHFEVQVAGGGPTGGAHPPQHLRGRQPVTDGDVDPGEVVVGGGEAAAVPLGMPKDDPVAVAAGPAGVLYRPFERGLHRIT